MWRPNIYHYIIIIIATVILVKEVVWYTLTNKAKEECQLVRGDITQYLKCE